MASDPDLARALGAVQRVIGSPGFVELVADRETLEACVRDPAGTLAARRIGLPEEVRRVEARARHTPPAARQRGLRGGNVEWRFYVQAGAGSWQVVWLCDAWPVDAGDTAARTS